MNDKHKLTAHEKYKEMMRSIEDARRLRRVEQHIKFMAKPYAAQKQLLYRISGRDRDCSSTGGKVSGSDKPFTEIPEKITQPRSPYTYSYRRQQSLRLETNREGTRLEHKPEYDRYYCNRHNVWSGVNSNTNQHINNKNTTRLKNKKKNEKRWKKTAFRARQGNLVVQLNQEEFSRNPISIRLRSRKRISFKEDTNEKQINAVYKQRFLHQKREAKKNRKITLSQFKAELKQAKEEKKRQKKFNKTMWKAQRRAEKYEQREGRLLRMQNKIWKMEKRVEACVCKAIDIICLLVGISLLIFGLFVGGGPFPPLVVCGGILTLTGISLILIRVAKCAQLSRRHNKYKEDVSKEMRAKQMTSRTALDFQTGIYIYV
ncbi:unnamed protein product [Clavelina lepadiformis]|uniref:Uncharacterized protein n=1 Tax=Clavelina lepadiformis TaxID=159417 RepID=A0ABP0GHD2_CLALP